MVLYKIKYLDLRKENLLMWVSLSLHIEQMYMEVYYADKKRN